MASQAKQCHKPVKRTMCDMCSPNLENQVPAVLPDRWSVVFLLNFAYNTFLATVEVNKEFGLLRLLACCDQCYFL